MTWTKLSDDFSDECWTLSDGAYRLLVEMLNYSNRKLLDCRIPKGDLRRFAKHPEAVDELAAGGWVKDGGAAWLVAFQSLYQPLRVDVVARRARSAENGKKGGRPRKNPDVNPDGNPDGNPDENPGGRDGTGQYGSADSVKNESAIVTLDDAGSGLNPSTDPPRFEKFTDEHGRTITMKVA